MTSPVQIRLLDKGQGSRVTGTLSRCGAKIRGELTRPSESQLRENGTDGLNGKELEEISSIYTSVLTSLGTWKNTVGCRVGCAE